MHFKERIENNETLHGMIVTMNPSSVTEMLSECGYDWLWFDMEHAPLSLMDVQQMAQAKSRECAALVRIPVNSGEWIRRVLDLGVEGIIVPHVNTKAETERAVDASYYPPEGSRSVGMARCSCYGMDGDYKKKANGRRLLFVQVEHKVGVENIEEIVQVSGLDGIIIGPYDLSGSYGKLGLIHDPEVLEAIEKVLDTCKRYQKTIGIFAKHAEDAKNYIEQGFQLVATGVDIHFLWNAAKESVSQVKNRSVSEALFPTNWM